MQRYFVRDATNWQADNVYITDNDVHHITRVMRMHEGEQIICSDGLTRHAKCEITNIQDQQIELKVIEWLENDSELPVEVTIAQGLPKGDKFEFILQKATELGATGFIPYQADRSVTKWNEAKFLKKQSRFEKIIKEASEQSHRNHVPALFLPHSLKMLLEESKKYDLVLFAYEETVKKATYESLGKILDRLKDEKRILICIGPEGGFTDEEVSQFKAYDWIPIRLGKRILRTETASLYALSSISYHLEELRC